MKSSDQASVMFRSVDFYYDSVYEFKYFSIEYCNTTKNCIPRFIKQPEFVKVGQRILFREGRTKGIGKVTQVFPFECKEMDR